MLDRLFPRALNNNYQGYAIAKWIFYLITLITIVRSLLHMFLPDGGAQSIATIPLNTFTSNGAATVILIFALWGASQLLMAVVYLAVIWRYQAWIPFMYLLIFLEYSFRMFFMHVKPVHITGTAPGHVADYVMVPLALVMLVLSLQRKQ
ncbi:hypothetical protein [Legionella oakridgensis]|uniref:Transmembrane protein n=2 Tax=Legionella oakridgensis TaxID=29423 RepID=W0BEQ0_9GAMM|nr:hypothetical protein [Legionella oakridgensis]AHE66889.1 hypothetical protein Loa_01336 [Legionella oakridgensis ATCC 33761 = DSM 21215]ETO93458.1 hypothetical protein LOR_46c07950 [Legionella oakridgensis RV-2-2007]KTD39776.1 hypothetical protein Loak_0883 [Legionella oakridgensis]STY19997.1 Uncharacterised protein [Legionella longbeachae]